MINFKNKPEISKFHTIVNNGDIHKALVGKRHFLYYEYNGMLKRSLGTENHLMVGGVTLIKKWKPYRNIKMYNFSNWTNSKPKMVNIFINKSITNRDFASLMFYQFWDYDQFEKNVTGIINFKINHEYKFFYDLY